MSHPRVISRMNILKLKRVPLLQLNAILEHLFLLV